MIRFEKYQGVGNDFIIIHEDERLNYSVLATTLCDRHFGVGADGLLVFKTSEIADFRMRIFNSDGSEAMMCANGLRCLSQYAYDEGFVKSNSFTVETKSGVKEVEILPPHKTKINLGKGQILKFNEEVNILSSKYNVSIVDTGIVHIILFLDTLDVNLDDYVREFKKMPIYNEEVSINFCKVIDQHTLYVNTYESGVGFTLACGTGCAAAYIISKRLYEIESKVTFNVPGGKLVIEDVNEDLYLSGTVAHIYSGIYHEND